MGKRSSGEGTIVRRGDGRWVGAITLSDGRRKWVYGKTQGEVTKKVAAARRNRDDGIELKGSDKRTLANYLESWLEMRRPSLKPDAYSHYRWYTQKHILPTLGRTQLVKLSAEQVQQLLAKKLDAGLSPTTVRHIHAVIRNALNEAVRLQLVPRNVALLVKKPRRERQAMQTWTPEQVRQFLSAASEDRFYAFYVVALTTGMRAGELLGLRWRDVDLDRDGDRGVDAGAVYVQRTLKWREGVWSLEEVKTAAGRRHIRLSGMAVAALRAHRARQSEQRLKLGPIWRESDLVFCNSVGGAMRLSNLRFQSYVGLVKAAGVPYIRIHDLRHTAATVALLDGQPPKAVSEMLGHSSSAITQDLYGHVQPTVQRQMAEAFDRLYGVSGGK